MKLRLIDGSNENVIGEIDIKFPPVVGNIIIYGRNKYHVNKVFIIPPKYETDLTTYDVQVSIY